VLVVAAKHPAELMNDPTASASAQATALQYDGALASVVHSEQVIAIVVAVPCAAPILDRLISAQHGTGKQVFGRS
jgi:hypothetical protein